MANGHVGKFLENKQKFLRKTLTWLFTAIYALAGVSFWRGVWFLMKLDIGIGTVKLLSVLCVSLAVLISTGVSRSLISSPLALSLDDHDITFKRKTFFRKSSESNFWLFIDVIFTNLVIRQLIVFCWWSLWSLENKFFPHHKGEEVDSVSYDSLFLGYAGAALCLMLDKLIQNLITTKLYIIRPAATLVTILAFFSSVNVWRGLWSLLNLYFLPNIDHDENYVIGHVVGLVALSVMMLANTIANDSIAEDIETDAGVSICYWSRNNYTYTPVRQDSGQEEDIVNNYFQLINKTKGSI